MGARCPVRLAPNIMAAFGGLDLDSYVLCNTVADDPMLAAVTADGRPAAIQGGPATEPAADLATEFTSIPVVEHTVTRGDMSAMAEPDAGTWCENGTICNEKVSDYIAWTKGNSAYGDGIPAGGCETPPGVALAGRRFHGPGVVRGSSGQAVCGVSSVRPTRVVGGRRWRRGPPRLLGPRGGAGRVGRFARWRRGQ